MCLKKETVLVKIGLVLEGGGLRATYTVGVLDCLMDRRIFVDYVIGVSAGACHGTSYVSGQRGRARRINTKYVGDPRYIGLGNLIKTKSIFGMDFVFNTIPNQLEIFDYDFFAVNPCEFWVGVTEMETGYPEYFPKTDLDHDTTILQASCSLPLVGQPVSYKGKWYMDGGISDPIPAARALKDGCDKLIVVLTRHRDYEKDPEGKKLAYKHFFRKYPAMTEAMATRHIRYKESQELVCSLEQEGRALVLAPEHPLDIGRFETDPIRLEEVYQEGYMQTAKKIYQICEFLDQPLV